MKAKTIKTETALPLVPYFGGKARLAPILVEMIGKIPHICYAEPFVGAGGVFFRRKRPARSEVINDRGRDIASLFRVVKFHPQAFEDALLRLMLASRAEFERQLAVNPDTLTDIERAARFAFLQRLRYSARPGSSTFITDPLGPSRLRPKLLRRLIELAHRRLESVTIECMGWREFVAAYDRPTTLFYLDPPYWGLEKVYGAGLFERGEFETMAEALSRLKGRFILSLNDHAEVRRVFRRFRIRTVEVRYSVASADQTRKYTELVITGGAGRRA